MLYLWDLCCQTPHHYWSPDSHLDFLYHPHYFHYQYVVYIVEQLGKSSANAIHANYSADKKQ